MAGLEAANAVEGSNTNPSPLTTTAITSMPRRTAKRERYRGVRTELNSGAPSQMSRPSRRCGNRNPERIARVWFCIGTRSRERERTTAGRTSVHPGSRTPCAGRGRVDQSVALSVD